MKRRFSRTDEIKDLTHKRIIMTSRTFWLVTKYWFLSYWIELLTGITGLATSLISYFFFNNPSLALWLTLVVIFFGFLFALWVKTEEKQFYFTSLTERHHKDEWLGRGVFDYDRQEHCHYITDSDPKHQN